MAIIKDSKRNHYYINYKLKLADGVYKNINIKNKLWIIAGENAVTLRYMKSIELKEIEKDKEKRSYACETGTLGALCEAFYIVLKADGIDEETIYNYKLSFNKHLFTVINKNTAIEKAFEVRNIDAFRIYLTRLGLKNHTINNKMVALKNLLKFAKTRKYIPRELADDAIDILKPFKDNERISEHNNYFANGDDDVRKFIDTFASKDENWRIPILALFYGAFRVGEWQAISVEDIDFDNCSIVINKQIDNHGKIKAKTKNGNDRLVRLPHTFMNELKDYLEIRNIKKGLVFVNDNGSHINRQALRNVVNKHLELAGLSHITLHGLRHTFATRMFDRGYDVKEVQEHLGHTNMQTTMKYYIHYTNDKKKKDLEDLL